MQDLDNGAAEAVTEQTDSRQSLEEQMGAVYDQMEQTEASAAEVEAAVIAEPEDKSQEETQPEADKGPERGPDGKFVAKEAEKPEAEATSEETADQGAEEGEGAVEQPTQDAPTSWSAAAKAEWAKLPPAIQQEVLKREGDFVKGLEERATRLKSYEPIEQALEPIRQQLDLNGVSPGQYVRQLVAAEQFLQRNPGEAIQYLARNYGVDLQGLTQQQAEQPQADPAMAALQQQVQDLSSRQAEFYQHQAQQQEAAVSQQIEAFKADPANKHFDTVYEDMVSLAAAERAAGKEPSLPDLYQRAIWANPSVREQLLAEQRAEADKKAAEEKAKRAKEAQRAAAANIGTQGTSSGETPAGLSLEEELARTYDRVNGAA